MYPQTIEPNSLNQLQREIAEYRAQIAERQRLAREIAFVRERLKVLAALIRLDGGRCVLPWEEGAKP